MYGDSNKLGRGIQGAGASGNVFPTIIAINTKTNEQIAFDEKLNWNLDTVNKWLDGLLDGSTTTFKKSEPIPENNNGPVTTLVADNLMTLPLVNLFLSSIMHHGVDIVKLWLQFMKNLVLHSKERISSSPRLMLLLTTLLSPEFLAFNN